MLPSMGIAIKEDLLYPHAMHITRQAFRIVRKFQVTGLEAYSATKKVVMAATGTDAVTGFQIPQLGASHPDEPSAVVVDIKPQCQGYDCFDTFVTYEWQVYPSNFLESFSASLVERITHYDAAGNLAVVQYTPAGATAAKKKVAALRRLVLSATVTFHFLETANPETLTLQYAGMVNSAAWRNQPPRTWLCLPINGSTQDGIWYRNAYAFAYNPQTWDEYAVFENVDGVVPQDVSATIDTSGATYSGNGWGRFIVYGQVDFNAVFPNIVG